MSGGGLAFTDFKGSGHRPIFNHPAYGFSNADSVFKGTYPNQKSYNNSQCGGKRKKKSKKKTKKKRKKKMLGGGDNYSFTGKYDPSISNYNIGQGQGIQKNQYSNSFKEYNHYTGEN